MDRLSPQDLSMLWPDDFGWPQDIGAIGILDGAGLGVDAVRRAVAERLALVPRFRQVIHVPGRGLGRPLWVDAPEVDLEWHVRVAAVSGEADLLPAVERLRRRPLDRSRPLWDLWLLTGLPDGRVGCFLRAHHVVADGVAGMATLATLLGGGHPVAPGPPRPPPAARALLADTLRGRRAGLTRAVSRLAHPARTGRALRAAWPTVHGMLGERAPRMSLNRPLGPRRTLAVVRGRLDVVKRIAHARQATANDVLLSAIAGGLRDLLLGRGEPVDGVVPRAYVPVAARGGPRSGNHSGLMIVSLPVGVADPVDRLRAIAAETAVRRSQPHPAGAALVPGHLAQRAFLAMMANQRWANTYVANVPGPPAPLSLAGAPLLELFPLVPLIGNVTLGVGALSYAGQFNLTVVADPDACPDAAVFTAGLRHAVAAMERESLPAGPR